MRIPSQSIVPFLSFNGNAEEAMNFYTSILPNSKIEAIAFFEKEASHGDEGKVLNGVFEYRGQRIMFLDMTAGYPAPDFNWAVSLFINCLDENEFDLIFAGLSDRGIVMMGPEPVMHMRKCAWVTDRFGVTWQLVWE